MPPPSFTPGTVVSARNRLWRIDQQKGEVLTATPLDGSQSLNSVRAVQTGGNGPDAAWMQLDFLYRLTYSFAC